MKKYGFFGGSFNPPTYAHLEIAIKAINKMKLDKVFFVPVGNTYKKPDLIDEKIRLNMLKIMCENEKNIEVEEIELNQKEHLTTIDVFEKIEKKYKDSENYYIMGADNFSKLPNWNKAEQLLLNHKFIISTRINYDILLEIENNPLLKKYENNIDVINLEDNVNCSSGIIRSLINEGEYIKARVYTKTEIINYIKENKLYKVI